MGSSNPRRRIIKATMHGNPERRNRPTSATPKPLRMDVVILKRAAQPYESYCNHHNQPCSDQAMHKARKDASVYCNHTKTWGWCETREEHVARRDRDKMPNPLFSAAMLGKLISGNPDNQGA